jgi:hypothetical protein
LLAGLIVVLSLIVAMIFDALDGDSGLSSTVSVERASGTDATAEPTATVATAFDFAVIGPTGRASRGWTMQELEELPKRTVNAAGGETVEGPSLLDLLAESGEEGWQSVTLVRTPAVTLARDAVDEDWVLLFESGVARFTLVNPRFPRATWVTQIVQFNVDQ